MTKKYRYIALALLSAIISFSSCGKDEPIDPAQREDPKKPVETEKEYKVDQFGYATYEYEGFSFKLKESLVNTSDAKAAVKHMKEDLDKIISFCPAEPLKIMKKNPIWMEESHKVSKSAAWYHKWADYPASIGDLSAKGKCVEITNYKYYVSWSNLNQPMMVFHELSHLYHDQGLGGDTNTIINAAYKNAKNKNLYYKTKYRATLNGTRTNIDGYAYCMNDNWEFFAEMSEAYWGENDYYPFNYEDLKAYDPVAFDAMVKIWGARKDKE